MTSLAWIWKQIGVNEDPWRYDGTIPIPLGGEALVMLQDAKGARLQYDRNCLKVTEVDPDIAYAELISYVVHLGVWGDVSDGLVHSIEPAMTKELHDGSSKLYSVEGKVVCKSDLGTGTNGDIDKTNPSVFVFPKPRTYKVSFRFLAQQAKYPNATWTRRNTTEVDAWISHLNWIYGSQAGIKFELGTTEPFDSLDPLTSQIYRQHQKAYFEPRRDNKADITVFLPGYFNFKGDSNVHAETYHPPDWGEPPDKGSWVIRIADDPDYNYIKYPDRFISALAHELSHAIRNDTKESTPDEEGISSTVTRNTKIGPRLRVQLS
jgi:hypothetical protein